MNCLLTDAPARREFECRKEKPVFSARLSVLRCGEDFLQQCQFFRDPLPHAQPRLNFTFLPNPRPGLTSTAWLGCRVVSF
jgi:hypothetical protein